MQMRPQRPITAFESAAPVAQDAFTSTTSILAAAVSHFETAREPQMEFALSVVRGLSESPKRLDCRFLYDSVGSELFERITEQPEYYPTRSEASILEKHAGDIAESTGPVTLIELGSGSSTKTRLLLQAYTRTFGAVSYTPVDVSLSILEQAEEEIAAAHPEVSVESLHGTYEEAFPKMKGLSPALVLFLGGTIGNLDQAESAVFWEKISSHLLPGDFCLLGLDGNDDPDSLNAAYNDAAGLSEAFTVNIFERMNRELSAGLDVSAIRHVAEYVPERRRIEIFAEFAEEQTLKVGPLDWSCTVRAGERIMTEMSRRFDIDGTQDYLATFGLRTKRVFRDADERFALILLARA